MAGSYILDADVRDAPGRGGARRLRREGKIPAILYGGSAEPLALVFDHNKINKALEDEATYSHILTLRYNGKEETAILKAMQRHPSRPVILHMDFQRVSESQKIRVHVPLHFINQDISVGVKKGGVVTHAMTEVEVTCLPARLPEYIEVDLSKIDVGQTVHLTELKVPPGVEIVELLHGPGHDQSVAAIQPPRVTDEAE